MSDTLANKVAMTKKNINFKDWAGGGIIVIENKYAPWYIMIDLIN